MAGRSRALLHTSLFFLRTTLFDVRINPSLAVLLPFLVVLRSNKHAALFLMLFYCLTFLFTRPFGADRGARSANTLNMGVFHKLLPVRAGLVPASLALVILFYSVVIQGVLLVCMLKAMDLPHHGEVRVSFDPGSTITTVRGVYRGPRGFERSYVLDLYPSLIFGIVKDGRGYPAVPGFAVLVPLTLISITAFLLVVSKLSVRVLGSPGLIAAYAVALCVVAALLLIVLADTFFPYRRICALRDALDRSGMWAPAMVGLLVTGTVASLGGLAQCARRWKGAP
jgi:hypothetical protein